MIRTRFLFFIFLIIILNSCKNSGRNNINDTGSMIINTNKEKKFDWLPTECAPEIYPIRIKEGVFVLKDGNTIKIPSGGRTVNNGWGKIGSTYVVGDDLKAIPKRITITWISYAENKFYKGDFELPSEKIEQFFEKGFLDRRNKQQTYSRIVVGMAPGGVLSVWLLGPGSTLEIGQYIAQEIDMDIKDISPNTILDRETYVSNRLESIDEEKLKKLKEVGVRTDIWKTYRKRFSWKPKYVFGSDSEATKILIDFYNGESIQTFSENPMLNSFQDLPLPKYIRFYWTDKNGNEFGSKIYFDEDEIYETFNKINVTSNDKQTVLRLEIDKYSTTLKLFVGSSDDHIELKKVKVKVFESSN